MIVVTFYTPDYARLTSCPTSVNICEMIQLEKRNMGRGDYWIYRSGARTKDTLINDLVKILEEPELSFPLFVLTSPPAFPISLEFRNRDEIRYFCQGFAFAAK